MRNVTEENIENAKADIVSTILNWGSMDFNHLAKVQIWCERTFKFGVDAILYKNEPAENLDINSILYEMYYAIESTIRDNVRWYLENIFAYEKTQFTEVMKEILGVDKLRISKVKFVNFVYEYFDKNDIEVYSNYLDYDIVDSPMKDLMFSDMKIEELVFEYIKFLYEKFEK